MTQATPCKISLSCPGSRAAGRRGFSFIEVLFAVMILGIGFIMVAAVFPVALTQTKTTGEETSAASVSRGAFNQLQNLFQKASDPNGVFILPTSAPVSVLPDNTPMRKEIGRLAALPSGNPQFWAVGESRTAPGIAFGFREMKDAPRSQSQLLSNMFNRARANFNANWDPATRAFLQEELWRTIKGNLILPTDARFAWVPIFRRDVVVTRIGAGVDPGTNFTYTPAAYAHVIVIAVQAPGGRAFSEARDLRRGPDDKRNFPAVLEPKVVRVTLVNNVANLPDTATFGRPEEAEVVSDGAYLVVSDDGDAGIQAGEALNGRVLRLGNRVEGSNTWELALGNDIPASDATMGTVRRGAQKRDVIALVVGRPYVESAAGPAQGYEGVAPDLAVYTGYIRVGN